MKRIRIWLNSFSLLQQYLTVSFFAITIFLFFVLYFLNSNINNFTNAQMYSYLQRSSRSYINAIISGTYYDDSNVYHYVYDTSSNKFETAIDPEVGEIVKEIEPNIGSATNQGTVINEDNDMIPYIITKYGNDYVVSIINVEYRDDFKAALLSAIVNASIIMVLFIFMMLMVWVYSLIRPLNLIRNYIYKIRNGEKTTLTIKRNDEIGEVAEAVVSMNEELSRQQRIREEMIQNISHDLKTPIATIKSYSESIKDGVYPYDTLEKSVDVIIEHANRLEKKVYSLITYNKIGYLEDNVEGDNVLMNLVIERAILSCKVLRNDININTDEVEYNVYFHGDEEAWRTVVENLIDNALRYAKSVINITLSENLLEVYNDGELMPKDRIDKLFKPYEKGNKGNFGLGLSIVKRVCDTYGYTVIGENKTDGVVFRIYRNKSTKNKEKSNKV